MTFKCFRLSMFTLLLAALCACQTDTDDTNNSSSQLSACTKELKVCPDGQTVARNPLFNCDFDDCPEPASAVECQNDMKQCPDGSFATRNPDNNCEFKPCPNELKDIEPIIYCTQEALQCNDGSYVGRDPKNNCAFKTCPDGSQPEKLKSSFD